MPRIKKSYLAVLFLLPLVFNPWGFDIYEIPKNIFFKGACSLILMGVLIQLYKQRNPSFPVSKKMIIFLILFLAVLVLSLLVSIRPEVSFWGTYFRQGGVINFLFYVCFFLLGLVYFHGEKAGAKRREHTFFAVVAYSGFVVSLYAILQKFGLDLYSSVTTDIFEGRSFSSLGNPTSLGAMLLFPIGACGYLLLEDKKNRSKYLILLVVLVVALLLSRSRGAVLGLALSSGLFFLKFFQKKPKVLIGLGLSGLLLLVIFWNVYGADTRSLNSRFTIWKSSAEIIAAYPIFGMGPENFSYMFEKTVQPEFFEYEDYRDLVDRPHNEFLEMWINFGFVGFVLYLLLGACLLREWWVSKKSGRLFASLTLLALIFTNFFGFSLVTQFVFAASFLSILAHSTKSIVWNWTLFKKFICLFSILLLGVNLAFQLRLALVDHDLKQAYLSAALEDLERVTVSLERAINWGSMYGEVYIQAFNINYAIAKTLQEDFYLRQAVFMNDEAKKIQKNTLLNRLNEASLFILSGKSEDAESIYLKAFEEIGPNPVLYENWAELYFAQERYAEALPLYEELLSFLPYNSDSTEEQRIFWKNHPDFLDVFLHILSTYEHLGQVDVVDELLEKIK